MKLRALLLVIAVCAVPVGAGAQRLPVVAVESVGFTVSDMDRAIDFYSRVLDFQKVSEERRSGREFSHSKALRDAQARVVRMLLGDEVLELTQYVKPAGRPFPASSRGNDRWFQHVAIITSNMDAAYARLRQNRVRHASSAPQTLPGWNKSAAGIRAFYFRDPDGHFLEVLQFPPDKGLPKWHRDDAALFLGIDHTAIVVGDTEQSFKLYRDTLGLRVAGESENYGVEQEHLNGVFGAHLRITSLRAQSGPGIEFLEYLAPTDGRLAPPAAANDIAHWETRLAVTAPNIAPELEKAGIKPFASGAGETLAPDPDGHVLALHALSTGVGRSDAAVPHIASTPAGVRR
jgi:catechol 2,3-dioxygenase-like lactoylglutathione lyase family enzyme